MNRTGGKNAPSGRRGGRAGSAEIEPFLLEVEIYLTNRCNLNCSYCSTRYMIHEEKAQRLTSAQLRRAFDLLASDRHIREKYGGRVGIDFKGGEPMLEFGLLEEAVEYIRDKGYGFKMGLSTNGTLLTPERMAFLDRNQVDVCVSLDGYKSVNDFYRKFRADAKKSVFDAVMANLKKGLSGRKFRSHMHVGTTFTPLTVGSIPAVVDYFRKDGGFRQVKIGLEVYDLWPGEAIGKFREVLRELKGRFLETLARSMANRSLESAFDEIQFSQYMRNLPHVLGAEADLSELAANPVSLFYDGYFYPSDLAVKPPVDEKYRIGDLERGIDFARLRELSEAPMFAGIRRYCKHRTGVLSPVEKCCWAAVHRFPAARVRRLLENASEVNGVFNAEMGACIRLQRTCEQLFMTPGFGDFTHEPKYRSGREIAFFRQAVGGGSGLVGLRAAADYFLYSPGDSKRLLLDARGGPREALDLAEGLAVYALFKAAYLKKRLGLALAADAGGVDADRLRYLAAHGVRVWTNGKIKPGAAGGGA